ncbi:MAG: cobalt-precorrin-5B (C(1))-methyltransferase [Alphaproteobacteria bacterium]|nr:cobalt-precorrin-5B (C(1))-methyltransferase [Alphaproteobacteria bacterium]
MERHAQGPLRRGWTTGACATAATRAAYTALLTGRFPDPVQITLPRGQQPSFPLAYSQLRADRACAGVIKDAGDDPDVTHGALVMSSVSHARAGEGIAFAAGPGVGTVTLPGLPVPVGEPAINPAPRRMMRAVIEEVSAQHGATGDVMIEVAIRNGARLAERTWNPRLGIMGGLSVLGTSGIVVPYSCSAWIHSIRRGIDVARATGTRHVGAATGSTSETATRLHHGLDETAMIDMGDFAGGMLKYLRSHPVPRLTIGGGFAKLTKLAQGALDLHSSRSQVDFSRLAALARDCGASPATVNDIHCASSASRVLELARSGDAPLADAVAAAARNTALDALGQSPVAVEVLIFDRDGKLAGEAYGW